MAKFDAGTPATRYAQARAEGLQKGFFGDNADAYVRDNYPEIFAGMGDNVSDLSIAKNPDLLAPIEEGINESYLDVFKRPASQDEINFYVNEFGADNTYDAGEEADLESRLAASVGTETAGGDVGGDAGGGVEEDVSTGVAGLPRGQITDLYQTELGRGPSKEEIKYYQNLYGDTLDPFEIRQFQSSPEAVKYRSRIDYALPKLYEDVLNRPPTADDLRFYKRDETEGGYGGFLGPQEVNRFIRAARFGDPTIGKEGEIITSLRDNLGIPTIRSADLEKGFYDTKPLDLSTFGAAPVTTGAGATAGIERLRPTDTTGTMAGVFASPQFTTPYSIDTQQQQLPDTFTQLGDLFGAQYKAELAEEAAEEAAAEEGMRGGGLASLYKEGGEVGDAGLANVAQKMASYGRYGDTMLAHISPEEAMMLKAMGGSGTRNPATGLPEFFLKKLIKKVYKIGKKILPSIVAMYNPAVGASLAAADAGFKDGKFDLKDAALAGVKTLALSKVGEGIAGGEGSVSGEFGGVGMGTITKDTPRYLESAGRLANIKQQLAQPFTDPKGFGSDLVGTTKALGSGVMDRGGEILSGDFSGLREVGTPAAVAGLAQTTEMGLDEAEKFRAEQGAVLAAQEDKKKKFRDLARRLGQQFPYGYNEGGISSLPPRYLDGEGDGMSDSIRANIDGSQEARLADGEFVVPADVVADIGNGSSNAGAERLYFMMDRVRQSRHGTTKQPPEVKVNRLLPA